MKVEVTVKGPNRLDRLLSNLVKWFYQKNSNWLVRAQLYTIHGFVSGSIVTLIYALSPDQRQETYENFLRVLSKKLQIFHQVNILIDFKKAMINAIHKVLPETRKRGYFFHFFRSIFRKIQNKGLKNWYNTNLEFSPEVKNKYPSIHSCRSNCPVFWLFSCKIFC